MELAFVSTRQVLTALLWCVCALLDGALLGASIYSTALGVSNGGLIALGALGLWALLVCAFVAMWDSK